MKATMLEQRDENDAWQWHGVYTSKTPKEALLEYLIEHEIEFSPDDLKETIQIRSGYTWFDFRESARAYTIDIED